MQGLILAAGRGSRLGDKSGGVAKCLIEIGRRPLIEHQIESLAGCGVGPVGMVVGYAADEIQEIVGIKAEYIRNPRWSVTNSLYSFWLAREWVTGDVVVLNSDVLFSPQILERLLDVSGDSLAYDSGSGERIEEMSVSVEDGRLKDTFKGMPAEEVSGENVGMLRLTHETAVLLFAKAEELIAQGREKDWFGSAVREIAKVRSIAAVDVHGLPWGEIDFPADLERARKSVWPAIKKTTRRSRPHFRLARTAALILFGSALAFATYRASLPHVDTVWETVAASGAETVRISDGTRHANWGLLAEGQAAALSLQGPTTLRIDARSLFIETGPSEAHFVLELGLDGGNPTWHSCVARPSGSWTYDGERVGKRVRIEVEIPPGEHVVVTTLSASDMGGCLFRFAQLDPED